LLTAVSGIAQFSFRLGLPWLLRRYPDRALIGIAAAMLACSYLLLVGSQALAVFLVAQLLQGGGRALFWTASQTHAVRGPGSAVRAVASVQVLGHMGNVAGPIIAGTLASISLEAALAVGVAVSLVSAAASLGLRTLAPYAARPASTGTRIWRRPGVDVACWAGFTCGGWTALVGSYVPVILQGAGLPPQVVGGLMALAEIGAVAAGLMLIRFPMTSAPRVIAAAIAVLGLGMSALPLASGFVPLAGLVIALCGASAGLLVSMGPAFAAQSVDPAEQGDAIAAVGTFRSAGLFLTPAIVAAGIAVVTVRVSFAAVGLALAAPAGVGFLRRRVAATRASVS
jgi:hypothetical protein